MASIKLKFRVSSLPEKEGTLYFQVIHERVVKQIGTSYRIYESEWDEHRSDIVMQSLISPNRLKTIKSVREKIAWEKNRLNKIIEQFKNKGRYLLAGFLHCRQVREQCHSRHIQASQVRMERQLQVLDGTLPCPQSQDMAVARERQPKSHSL